MRKIWSKDFEVGDFWTRTALDIIIGQPFQVVLETVIGDGYLGDISIDDTSFTPGCVLGNVDLVTVTTPVPGTTTPNPCAANNQSMCLENNQCIDQEKVCDFKVDCPGGSDEANCGTCTFDNNNGTSCGWKDYSYGSLMWSLRTGATIAGPSGDHTTGNGFYMAVPKRDLYGFSSMRTPLIGPAGIECQLKFWYYMDYDSSQDSSRISAYYRPASNIDSFTFITSITESTGPQWKQAFINIGHRTTQFAIGIEQRFL